MILSVLVPSTFDRTGFLFELMSCLSAQIKALGTKEVEVIHFIDNFSYTTGFKRNKLLQMATGEYVAFIDDDDSIAGDYVAEILKALEHKPDVVGFEGFMTTDGVNKENFKISKDLPYLASHDETGVLYLRFNNHLSPVKREIALQIGYADMIFGEDYDYAKRLHDSGLIKTEVYIKKDLYHYKFINKK